MNRPVMSTAQSRAHRIALAAWLALIALCLAWEWWLAPLRPGGSWLVAKGLVLLWPLRGLILADAATMQWALLLGLLYLLEGAVRVFEPAPVAPLAAAELALASTFYAAAATYLRPLKRAAKRRRSLEIEQ